MSFSTSRQISAVQTSAGSDRPGFVAAAGLAFSARFLCDEDCARWLSAHLHPEGPSCPGCGQAGPGGRGAERFSLFQRVQCAECGRFFTAASGTWMSGAKISPRQVMLLAALVAFGTDMETIIRVVGVSEVTVRYWIKKFSTIERVGA